MGNTSSPKIEEDYLISREKVIENKHEYLDRISSQFIKAVISGDYDFLEIYFEKKKATQDEINQLVLSSFWFSIYFKEIEMANFLINKYEYLKNSFNVFNNVEELENKFEDLVLFGRIINDYVAFHLIRIKEEFLAIIVFHYDTNLNEECLYYIIKYEMWKLLRLIYTTKKNYYLSSNSYYKFIDNHDPLISNNNSRPYSDIALEFISVKKLFSKATEINPEKIKEIVRDVLSWRLQIRENILLALLENDLDAIAVEQIELLKEFVNDDLIKFSIKNKNEEFLKYILISQYVPYNFMSDESLISNVVELLLEGETFILGLKILKLVQPDKLNINCNRKIINHISDIFDAKNFNKNVYFVGNIIFAIALSSEILKDISSSINLFNLEYKTFEIKCFNLVNQMVKIGEIFINEIEDQSYFEQIMYQIDFKNRSTIDIIISNNLINLLSDEKVDIIFAQLWEGPRFLEYENGLDKISISYHSLWSKIEVVCNPLTYLFKSLNSSKEINFILQNKYRRVASNYYYYYEFIFTFIMLILLQVVYLAINDNPNNRDSLSIDLLHFIHFLNGTSIGTTFLRLIFNIRSSQILQWDSWMIFDFIVSLLNFINIFLIDGSYHNSETDFTNFLKSLKYFNIVVIIFNWIRFYMLFLCILGTSYLIMTLVYLMKALLSFLIIMVFYFVIVTTFMYIVFREYIVSTFPNYFMTFNYLFDAMMGQINHPTFAADKGTYDTMHKIFLAIHVLSTNVILLNYLIAILSQIFQENTETTEKRTFYYRFAINQYTKRYCPGMVDSKYGNLILIQPPFNVLCGIFLIFDIFQTNLKKVVYIIEFLNFWMVNIFFSLMYTFYLTFLLAILYFKMFSVISNLRLKIWTIFYYFCWIFAGPIILALIGINDIINLFYILSKNYQTEIENNKLVSDRDRKIFYGIFKEIGKIVDDIFDQIDIEMLKEESELLRISKDLLLKYIMVNEVEEKINNYLENGKFLNIKSIGKNLFRRFTNNNVNKKTKNLDYIIDHFEDLEIISKYPEINKLIDDFLIKFSHKEKNNDLIEMEIFRMFLKKSINFNNIDKYLMINFRLIKITFKQIKNSDFYGIKDYFNEKNIERNQKVCCKIKNIKNHFKNILKSHGITDFRHSSLNSEISNEKEEIKKKINKKILNNEETYNKYSIIGIIKRKMKEIEGNYTKEDEEFKLKNKKINFKIISDKIKQKNEFNNKYNSKNKK